MQVDLGRLAASGSNECMEEKSIIKDSKVNACLTAEALKARILELEALVAQPKACDLEK